MAKPATIESNLIALLKDYGYYVYTNMTKEELQKLYEDLEAEEKSLRTQLDVIAQKNPMVKGDYEVKVPNYGEDEDENAHEATDLDRNLIMASELEARLNEVIKTKKQIKEGTYSKQQF